MEAEKSKSVLKRGFNYVGASMNASVLYVYSKIAYQIRAILHLVRVIWRKIMAPFKKLFWAVLVPIVVLSLIGVISGIMIGLFLSQIAISLDLFSLHDQPNKEEPKSPAKRLRLMSPESCKPPSRVPSRISSKTPSKTSSKTSSRAPSRINSDDWTREWNKAWKKDVAIRWNQEKQDMNTKSPKQPEAEEPNLISDPVKPFNQEEPWESTDALDDVDDDEGDDDLGTEEDKSDNDHDFGNDENEFKDRDVDPEEERQDEDRGESDNTCVERTPSQIEFYSQFRLSDTKHDTSSVFIDDADDDGYSTPIRRLGRQGQSIRSPQQYSPQQYSPQQYSPHHISPQQQQRAPIHSRTVSLGFINEDIEA